MLKQPLFGQDSSPHITSMLLSAIFTLVAWIIFCVMCLVIKFKPQVPEYKEVQIVLSSTPIADPEPVEGLVEEAAAATEESVAPEPVEAPELPKPAETPVAEAPKKDAAPAKSQTQKTTAAKKETQTTKATDPSKKVNFDDFQYATDYSDFDPNSISSKTNKSSFDWSQFDDSEMQTQPEVSQKVDKVTNSSSISGSAASTSNANQRQTSASSSSNKSTSATPSASSSTSSAAESIKNASGTTSTSSNNSNSSNQQKFSSDLDISWNGGTVRKQMGALSISLSSAAGSYITEKKTTVKIEFTVDEKGYVIAGSVKITPESILHEKVRKEVIDEINKWRFNEAPNRSTATFEYTIIKD